MAMPRRHQLPDLPEPAPHASAPDDAFAPLLPDDFPVRERLAGAAPPARSPRAPRPVPTAGTAGRAALGLAAPHVITAGLAWAGVIALTLVGTPGYPVWLVLVIAVQAAGLAIAWFAGLPALARLWLLDLLACAVLLPLFALETSLAGAPYVSIAGGSAGLALLVGLASLVALVAVAIVSAVATWEAPEQAGLLFVPAALLVPAILGIRQDLGEARALGVVGEVFAIAAIVILLAGLVPPGLRLLVGPAALFAQIVVLWATGRGPSYQATSGDVVPTLYALLLVATVVLTVAVPIFAYWVRAVAKAASRPPSPPLPPAPNAGRGGNGPRPPTPAPNVWERGSTKRGTKAPLAQDWERGVGG